MNAPVLTVDATASDVCFDATNPGTSTLNYSFTNSPTTYSITWSPSIAGGDVTNASLSGSPINITIPANTPANTYTGTITVSNGSCTSDPENFTLTVKALPVATFNYLKDPVNYDPNNPDPQPQYDNTYCSAAPGNPSPQANPLPNYSGGGVAGTFSSIGRTLYL